MKLYAFLFSAGTVSSQILSELGGWTKTTNDGDYLNPRSLGFGHEVMEMTDYDLNLIDDARAGAGSKAYKKKLEREEERKKKIAEKLAAGKVVGQNKREKGKTAYIEHYIGPNGEIDWNKSNVEKPVETSKPTKKPKYPTPVKTTADPYAPDSPDDEDDQEHDGPSNAYAPPTKKPYKKPSEKPSKKPSKKPKKPSKKPSNKPYAPKPEPTTPEPTTSEPMTTSEPTTVEPTTEDVTTEAITTKPKKNPYAPEPTTTPPVYETTTTAEATTTSKLRSTWRPDLTTTTEKPSKNPYAPPGENGDDGYGDDGGDMDNVYAPDSEVKGDPHFMVRSPGQEAVCFDADAPPGEQIPLVFDPVIGLSISGTIENRELLNRTVIDTMHILTPGGVSVHISHDSLVVDGYRNPFKKIHPKLNTGDGQLSVGDLTLKQLKRGIGLRAVRFSIQNGPEFHVQEKLITKAMGLIWENEVGLSDKTRGVLGQFMKHSVYHITFHKHTLNKGTLHIHGKSIPVEKLHHEHHDCWTLKQKDTEKFLDGTLASFGSF